MPVVGICLTHIFPYKDKIVDPAIIQDNTGLYSGIFYAVLIQNIQWYFDIILIHSTLCWKLWGNSLKKNL